MAKIDKSFKVKNMNIFDTVDSVVHHQIKTHRRAGMNINIQVIPLEKSWAIKNFSCLFREGFFLWIKSPSLHTGNLKSQRSGKNCILGDVLSPLFS